MEIGYDTPLSKISFNLYKGQKLGVIGANGTGKSTLLKTIVGKEKPISGNFVLGHNVKIGYFDQKMAELFSEKTIFDDFYEEFSNLTVTEIRNSLAAFMFYGEDVFKKISMLSGGEKVRYALCKILKTKPNFLILDEPTSGLDPVVRSEILDIFRKYIEEDEERSILLSTHITTDLEHISDYIVFIDKGKIVLNVPTLELLEEYGVAKCTKEEFSKINEKDCISYKKGKYQYEVLVNDKNSFKKKYNITSIDKPSIDDIMLFYIKGER